MGNLCVKNSHGWDTVQMNSHRRIIGLDIFRILLTLLIFLFHSKLHYGCDYGLLNNFVSMGSIAMTGFFMLSGFSLSVANAEVLRKEEKHSLRQFYFKRIISIYPAYIIVSIIYCFTIAKESFIDNCILLPIELMGIQSYIPNSFLVSHHHQTWFISCLFFCYAIYPFILYVFDRMKEKELLIVGIILCFLILWIPIVVNRFDMGSMYDSPFYRILEFGLGILTWKYCDSYPKQSQSNVVMKYTGIISYFILIVIVSFAVKLYIAPNNSLMYNWFALPCFTAILITAPAYSGRFMNRNVLGFLCNISYAFFLNQFFVWKLSDSLIGGTSFDTNVFRIVVSFLICFLLSVVLYYMIKKPSSWILKRHLLSR